MQLTRTILLLPLVASSVFAHPIRYTFNPREIFTALEHVHDDTHAHKRAEPAEGAANTGSTGGLASLLEGNKRFQEKMKTSDPNLLRSLVDNGQKPEFMFIGCSDSRVSESNIFDSKPGTFFTERNIANQYSSRDSNVNSILSYAVTVLGVQHVIVVGHYGCGGVAASIASAPKPPIDAANAAVQAWIDPIRQLYLTSEREEIVKLREENAKLPVVEEPEITVPGFRALVEENVKRNVQAIASDPIMTGHWQRFLDHEASNKNGTAAPAKRSSHGEGEPPKAVFVHGWVYDLANGEIKDLKISQGPPGKKIEAAPEGAAEAQAKAEAGVKTEGEPKAEGEPKVAVKEPSPAEKEQMTHEMNAVKEYKPAAETKVEEGKKEEGKNVEAEKKAEEKKVEEKKKEEEKKVEEKKLAEEKKAEGGKHELVNVDGKTTTEAEGKPEAEGASSHY